MTRSRSPTRSRSSSPTSEGSSKPMASLGSSIRSAARDTSSAYKRLPIRWRLAGGSALLTLVILIGFATIVGVLTARQLRSDFNREVADSANDLQRKVRPRPVLDDEGFFSHYSFKQLDPDLDDYAAGQRSAVIRLVTADGHVLKQTANAPYLLPPREPTQEFDGYLIESRPIQVRGGFFFVQYAREISDVEANANRVRVFLGLGVLGGAALALLAGLATARRAMAPI